MAENKTDYLLGINQYELERLELQHGVWKDVTESFFDRLGVKEGWKVLDVGSGPGFVAMDLFERVGGEGEVTALEPSEMYRNYFKDYSEKKGWKNIKFISGNAETAALPENYYDLIFARWVIGFVADPQLFIGNLKRALRPGGIIAFQDYAFHGLYLYPRGGAYENLSIAVQDYWKYTGGDLTIAVRIPQLFKQLRLELVEYRPNSIAGSPGSGIFKWHDAFITHHVPLMAEKNIISKHTADAILKDWAEHKNNPESIFFSPLVVDIAGRKA